MQKKYPGMQVESVNKSPIAGLYEVLRGRGGLAYTDENVNYLIVGGRLIDVAGKSGTSPRSG